MTPTLRRVVRLVAAMAYVGSYSEPAHALYASVGFREYNLSEPWVKVLLAVGDQVGRWGQTPNTGICTPQP